MSRDNFDSDDKLAYSLEMPVRFDVVWREFEKTKTANVGKKVKKICVDLATEKARIADGLWISANQAFQNSDVDFSYIDTIPPHLLPKWKNLKQHGHFNHLLRAISYQLALAETGHLIPFTFNPTPVLLQRATKSAKKGLVDYIRRALARNLKERLGYAPRFWFAIEFDRSPGGTVSRKKGRPHIHGALSADPKHHRAIRKAFHDTNIDYRNNTEFKKRAIRLHIDKRESRKAFGGDIHWACYALKQGAFTRLFYLPGESLMTADQETRTQAERIYSETIAKNQKGKKVNEKDGKKVNPTKQLEPQNEEVSAPIITRDLLEQLSPITALNDDDEESLILNWRHREKKADAILAAQDAEIDALLSELDDFLESLQNDSQISSKK